ncbi:FMN-binding protein [Ruminococcaceae bacterium OttesenSCG-928-O06]|nr:FMN-binding protein [Ruminococcaceae bacterium OttesenSCG-928-O06]
MTSDLQAKPARRLVAAVLAALLPVLLLCACAGNTNAMQDGFYTAEAADFDEYGWKEYITIYVKDNTIVTVDYNAKNASGFIKSWDMEYMRVMNEADGTYPNEYTRGYSEALLNRQNPDRVHVIAGATHSHTSFRLLAKAAMAQARNGDANVVFVDLTGAQAA